jgi:hypothetical protein
MIPTIPAPGIVTFTKDGLICLIKRKALKMTMTQALFHQNGRKE